MGRGYNWWLDERASAGRENLDADHVGRDDAKEDADAASELGLLQQLGLHRHSEIVDLGAGTGQFALAAASACARVVAVDVSSVMLQRLQPSSARPPHERRGGAGGVLHLRAPRPPRFADLLARLRPERAQRPDETL